MERVPLIAIIDRNTLSCIALHSILSDIIPFADIRSYNSFENFVQASHTKVFHYFVSEDTVLQNINYFLDVQEKVIVLTTTSQTPFGLSSFKTIDVSRSEKEIIKSFLSLHNTGHQNGHKSNPVQNAKTDLLSEREKDVLSLLVRGYINKEIADKLNISKTTVISHRNNIAEKLGDRSIGRLTIYAVLNGIVDLNELSLTEL